MRARDVTVGRCYLLQGGRTIKIASIAPDYFGLPTVYCEQPKHNRTLSLSGFLIAAVKEVPCP